MKRLCLALRVLVLCALAITVLAQDKATPIVTAAAPVERVRFAGSSSTVQMRIEVRTAGGTLVYDSDWKNGNLLDWLPRDSSDQPLAYGAYRLVMRSKTLAGETSEKEAALRVGSNGLAVDDQPGANPKITLTAHDGESGQLITTSGDLSFRFGDFLNRRDTEVMRLTRDGNLGIGTDKPQAQLDVNGLIRTSKGIMFSDGTILTTAAGMGATGDGGTVIRPQQGAPNRGVIGRPPILPLNTAASSAAHPSPRPNFAPAYQFVVGANGVNVGMTNPAYWLFVTGEVNTASGYSIDGKRIVSSEGTNVNVGYASGTTTPGYGENSFFGQQSGYSNTIGSNNAFFGFVSGGSNLTGNDNSFFGNLAGLNSTASQNTFMGSSAGYSTTGGGNNTAVGENSLYNNSSGASNIALGYNAGSNLTTGNSNIDIGNVGLTGEATTIRIGTAGTHTKAFIAGIHGVTTGGTAVAVVVDSNGQLGTVSSSRRYKFDIADMADATDRLMRLRPVTFRYLVHGDNAPIQFGLIAEEVADVYPEMVTRDKDGEVETVLYQFLAPMLLNEVQKQHRQIEAQQKTIEALRATLGELMQRVDQLEKRPTASR